MNNISNKYVQCIYLKHNSQLKCIESFVTAEDSDIIVVL